MYINVIMRHDKSLSRTTQLRSKITHTEKYRGEVPFTASRYTLSSLVAFEAPRRGENKHNLDISYSPQFEIPRRRGRREDLFRGPSSPPRFAGVPRVIVATATIPRCNYYAARAEWPRVNYCAQYIGRLLL